ncbi:hypothetical protein LFX25_03160 [Leptospira sp. FAT2]|uniref:hypothetical protein n=1 Tax=Leptospira sanjuanensis TaxID=2879643 RepID=UPI001EE964CB|nr:hypothetical protein [Leptospira sanjuanensis]MCG6166845.1 hypothetical protein [Leptospira sanjuanensis]MCG6192240.1 hypothetical protein [Leptospira sanjuanensis]
MEEFRIVKLKHIKNVHIFFKSLDHSFCNHTHLQDHLIERMRTADSPIGTMEAVIEFMREGDDICGPCLSALHSDKREGVIG